MIKTKLFNWIGGKKWLAPELNRVYSKYSSRNIEYYAEPFCGGLGSFLFSIDKLSELGIKKVFLNDINGTLIRTYNHLKNDKEELFSIYKSLELDYLNTIPEEAYSLHKKKDKERIKILLNEANEYYKIIRKKFNDSKDNHNLLTTAMFLFLAEHCFNGVYRENNKGEFNTPYNWETGKVNFDSKKAIFDQYNDIFNNLNIEFSNLNAFDFLSSLEKYKNTLLLYCDPPYLNEYIGENKYNKEHFDLEQQIVLLEEMKKFNHVVFSNHFYDIFIAYSVTNNFKYEKHFRNNIMNPKSNERKHKISEILAYKIGEKNEE